jgi:hypothetical protein
VNATGFPAFAKGDDGRRDTEQISGVVFLGTTLVAGRYQISDMTVRDRQKLNEELDWHGISGAGLLANGRVIGVLIARKTPNQRYDFSAVRIEALLAIPEFMTAIRGNAVLVGEKSRLSLPNRQKSDLGSNLHDDVSILHPKSLVEYLYCDLSRIDSYVSQIAKKHHITKTKLDMFSLHDKITLLIHFLKANHLLRIKRPPTERRRGGRKEEDHLDETTIVHETIKATRIIFPRLSGMADLLPDIAVWVAPPTEPPNLEKEDDTEPSGTFLYLIETHSHPERAEFLGQISGLSSLEMILRDLARKHLIPSEVAETHESRDNCSLPITVLKQAGGLVQNPRLISTLYRPRYLSDDQYVQVSGSILRCYDLYAYPIFIALAP